MADLPEVVAAWALGMTPATIAERYDIGVEVVEQAIAEHRAAREAIPSSAELQRDALDALEVQMERLSLLASQTATGPPARVAAIRTWRELQRDRLDLLREMGHVVPVPGADGFGLLLREFLEALRAEDVPQATLDRAAERALTGPAPPATVIAIEAHG